MVYSFARVGAVLKMRVEDIYIQGRRTWLRLHEKGGKRHEMPAHHLLDQYLDEYPVWAAVSVTFDPRGLHSQSEQATIGERDRLAARDDDVIAQTDIH